MIVTILGILVVILAITSIYFWGKKELVEELLEESYEQNKEVRDAVKITVEHATLLDEVVEVFFELATDTILKKANKRLAVRGEVFLSGEPNLLSVRRMKDGAVVIENTVVVEDLE